MPRSYSVTQPCQRSRRRSRIAQFKPPFVVSVAVPAALGLACGGKTVDVSTDDFDRDDRERSSEARRGSSGGIIDNPQTTCAGPPPAVPYDGCGGGAACVNGEWVMTYVACNSPPPSFNLCPASVPEAGTSCAGYEPGLGCDYPFCYGSTATMARCSAVSGSWESVPTPSCNPPEPECPTAAPEAGTSCYVEGEICRYGFCGEPGYAWLQCLNGAWGGNELPCPPAAVDAGAADAGG